MKIDIHSHLVKKNDQYEKDALLKDMEAHGIDMRVVSTYDGENIQQGNQDVSDFALEHPDKILVCARLNPKSLSIQSDLEHALSLPNVVMFELDSYEDSYYPDSEESVRYVLETLAKHNYPVKVFSGIGAKAMPQQWDRISQGIDNLNLIYLHMGCFDYGYSCVDIVNNDADAYIETSNQYEMQILRKAFDLLDFNKIVFGTTYPTRLTSNAIEIFDLFELSEEQRDQIFAKNTQRLLKLS